MKRRVFLFASSSMLLSLAACSAEPQRNEVRLTADEVRKTFIGQPWRSPSGEFEFLADGTYRYRNTNTLSSGGTDWRGPWKYSLAEDGTIAGATTNYTFYKGSDGYRYFHSKSGRFFTARPSSS